MGNKKSRIETTFLKFKSMGIKEDEIEKGKVKKAVLAYGGDRNWKTFIKKVWKEEGEAKEPVVRGVFEEIINEFGKAYIAAYESDDSVKDLTTRVKRRFKSVKKALDEYLDGIDFSVILNEIKESEAAKTAENGEGGEEKKNEEEQEGEDES